VQQIDWNRLYDDGFGDYLEQCRAQWVSDYDFVLLDSRTGASDIAGICTAHLPDRLVTLFTANHQSVRGAVDIARRANIARDKLPFDRPQLTVLPVLSRFDTREEYDRSEEWRQVCVTETKDLFANWLNSTVDVKVMSRHLTLPYVSYWSFGEQLAVEAESSPGPDQISYALETVAAVIAHHFDRTDVLAENRDAYVAEVRDRREEFQYDLRISTRRTRSDFAHRLVDRLAGLGIRAKPSFSGERSLLAQSDDDARHLCVVVDGEVSRWQSAEIEQFLRRSLGQDRRVIPVLTHNTRTSALSGYLRNLRYLRLGLSTDVADIARNLAGQLDDGADLDVPADGWPVVEEVLRDALLADAPAPQAVLDMINELKQRSGR
jgi:hypothetical protein